MNAAEERERVAALRAGTPVPRTWRTNTVLVQILFFVLTCTALSAFYGLTRLFEIPAGGIFTGLAAIALAEYLIGVRRWFFTGVEGALWLGGLLAFARELDIAFRAEVLLVLAVVGAIAGWRVRNPLFGAGAALAVVGYFEWKHDLGVLSALVIAAGAMLLLLRTWQRPSTEWLLIAIVLILPPAAWPMAGAEWRTTTIALYAGFALLAFLLGMAKRHHAMLLAGLVAISIGATELARTIAVRLEAKFFVAGALLLAIAFVIARALRGRTRGFVATPVKLTPIDDELQIAATVVTQPQAEAPAEEPGGRFGGAGASGTF